MERGRRSLSSRHGCCLSPLRGHRLPQAYNRDGEIHWAFMKWVHRNFDQRHRPAAEGLMATIK